MAQIRRGDIVWYENIYTVGSVQTGLRPWLVISNDIGNRYSPTVILAAITSQEKKNLPTHFSLDVGCGLSRPSTVLMEQLVTAPKAQLIGVVGHVDMNEIDNALAISVGLRKAS